MTKNDAERHSTKEQLMGIDNKYGRVTLEHGTIGEDEPVVVFRAQDRLLPKLLKVYRIFCELAGSPQRHLDLIDDTAARVKAWQVDHHTQIPRSDGYTKELGT
jgi:hypothetical protein